MTMIFEVSDQAAPADVDAVWNSLIRFNESELGPSGMRPLNVFVRGPGAEIRAGLVGRTAFGWLFIGSVWVNDGLRGQGVGRTLVDYAETEARVRGCANAWLDTFNPQAFELYKRLGYEPFGQIENYVGVRTRFFLRKSLEEGQRSTFHSLHP